MDGGQRSAVSRGGRAHRFRVVGCRRTECRGVVLQSVAGGGWWRFAEGSAVGWWMVGCCRRECRGVG